MVPKRYRGEGFGSRASRTYDHTKFVSEAASERCHAYLVNKNLIQERCLVPQEANGLGIRATINERGWGVLTSQPETAVVSIVKKNYANVAEAMDKVALVRGKSVPFDNVSINTYYNLTTIEEDEFTHYTQEELNWDEVIQHLCKLGAQWTIRGNKAASFPRGELSQYGNAWFYFLCAKLMPSSHVLDVIKSRAVLLFAIVTGKSIDVGRVIYRSILTALRGCSTGGLPHPSLICGLCKNAGVVWDPDEIFEQPKSVLDSNTIDRFKEWTGGFPDMRGAGYRTEEDDDVAAAAAAEVEAAIAVGRAGGAGPSHLARRAGRGSGSASSAGATLDLLLTEVRALCGAADNLGRGQEQLLRLSYQQTRRVDQIAGRVDTFVDHTNEVITSFANRFNVTGSDPIHFPPPPVFPDITFEMEETDSDDPADEDD